MEIQQNNSESRNMTDDSASLSDSISASVRNRINFRELFKERRRSMRRRLFGYMVMMAVILFTAVFTGFFLIGQYSNAKDELSDIMSLQMQVFEKDILSHHENLALRCVRLSDDTSDIIEKYLSQKGIAFDNLKNSPEDLKNIQKSLIPLLKEVIFQTECSGAYIILDTTVNSSLPESDYSKSSVYIQRSGTDITDETLLLYRGDAQLSKSMGIMPHRKWHLETNSKEFPDYDSIVSIKPHTSLNQMYITSDVIKLPGTSENIMLTSVPLFDSSGRVYGICGFEISESIFKAYHMQPTTLNHLCWIFSKKTSSEIDSANSLTAGTSAGYHMAPSGILSVKFAGSGLYSISNDSESYIGAVKYVNIRGAGSPEYTLSVMIPKTDYQQMASEKRIRLTIFILLLLFFAVCCCSFFSYRYISPILRDFERLKKSEQESESAAYTEIDDLFAFLAEKEKEKDEELNKIQSKVDKLAYSRKTEIDPDDYENFLAGLSTLTKTENRIFNLYLEGHTAKEVLEILDIKQSTLKFHNHNIYEKLGVSTRKQMLRYAAIYEQTRDSKS